MRCHNPSGPNFCLRWGVRHTYMKDLRPSALASAVDAVRARAEARKLADEQAARQKSVEMRVARGDAMEQRWRTQQEERSERRGRAAEAAREELDGEGDRVHLIDMPRHALASCKECWTDTTALLRCCVGILLFAVVVAGIAGIAILVLKLLI